MNRAGLFEAQDVFTTSSCSGIYSWRRVGWTGLTVEPVLLNVSHG